MKLVDHVIKEAWAEVNGLNCGERSGGKQNECRSSAVNDDVNEERVVSYRLRGIGQGKYRTPMQQELLTAADEASEVIRTCSQVQ
jgi:hypothetical protein